ncbi:MAG: hypothetical protein Q7V17_12310 [Afipia sp.]|nr:hypothetical protein [Afipia sp.]
MLAVFGVELPGKVKPSEPCSDIPLIHSAWFESRSAPKIPGPKFSMANPVQGLNGCSNDACQAISGAARELNPDPVAQCNSAAFSPFAAKSVTSLPFDR